MYSGHNNYRRIPYAPAKVKSHKPAQWPPNAVAILI